MSKLKDLAAAFTQNHARKESSAAPAALINPFNALFSVQNLSEKENRAIDKIFFDGYEPGKFQEEGVEADAIEIKRLTKELKAIRRQELILVGERIYQAREIFKKYKEGSFRDWMDLTFGSFKTGYNYLAFFDLYTALPEPLKNQLKEMPAKAAYILASKKAPLEEKARIVKSYTNETAREIIDLINTLGDDSPKRRRKESEIDALLTDLELKIDLLKEKELNSNQISRLQRWIGELRELCSS